jgi:hypothetical protein
MARPGVRIASKILQEVRGVAGNTTGRLAMISAPMLASEFDVVVVGSGSSGASAALAAAREGAKVCLLERSSFLGGTSTAVLDTFYGFYTPGVHSLKVVGGIGDDVVDRLKRLDRVVERPNSYGAGIGITYHPDYLKCAWEQLVLEAGVTVFLNCWVQDVELDSDCIESVIVATKRGLARVAGRTFVDASGDADLCFWSGSPHVTAGEHEEAQSLTTTFRMCNVDTIARNVVDLEYLHSAMTKAAEAGYALPRREGSDHATTVDGVFATNMTRIQSFELRAGVVINATDPKFLSDAEIEGRRQVLEYIRFLRDYIPGYRNAGLAALAPQIGIREARRIIGDYVLTREDVLTARQFDDQIGLCGAPIEDHGAGNKTKWVYLPESKCVGIPYRALLPQRLTNVLVAGRCFSATHDAHASVRSMAQCMAMGQAAGTAAALCALTGKDTRSLSFSALRKRLVASHAVLSVEAEVTQ